MSSYEVNKSIDRLVEQGSPYVKKIRPWDNFSDEEKASAVKGVAWEELTPKQKEYVVSMMDWEDMTDDQKSVSLGKKKFGAMDPGEQEFAKSRQRDKSSRVKKDKQADMPDFIRVAHELASDLATAWDGAKLKRSNSGFYITLDPSDPEYTVGHVSYNAQSQDADPIVVDIVGGKPTLSPHIYGWIDDRYLSPEGKKFAVSVMADKGVYRDVEPPSYSKKGVVTAFRRAVTPIEVTYGPDTGGTTLPASWVSKPFRTRGVYKTGQRASLEVKGRGEWFSIDMHAEDFPPGWEEEEKTSVFAAMTTSHAQQSGSKKGYLGWISGQQIPLSTVKVKDPKTGEMVDKIIGGYMYINEVQSDFMQNTQKMTNALKKIQGTMRNIESLQAERGELQREYDKLHKELDPDPYASTRSGPTAQASVLRVEIEGIDARLEKYNALLDKMQVGDFVDLRGRNMALKPDMEPYRTSAVALYGDTKNRVRAWVSAFFNTVLAHARRLNMRFLFVASSDYIKRVWTERPEAVELYQEIYDDTARAMGMRRMTKREADLGNRNLPQGQKDLKAEDWWIINLLSDEFGARYFESVEEAEEFLMEEMDELSLWFRKLDAFLLQNTERANSEAGVQELVKEWLGTIPNVHGVRSFHTALKRYMKRVYNVDITPVYPDPKSAYVGPERVYYAFLGFEGFLTGKEEELGTELEDPQEVIEAFGDWIEGLVAVEQKAILGDAQFMADLAEVVENVYGVDVSSVWEQNRWRGADMEPDFTEKLPDTFSDADLDQFSRDLDNLRNELGDELGG